VSAVGHYLEQEGIATVQISLIREHTAALKAPRALWVPFMLGRPFGVPHDVAFQTRVLSSALALLARTNGPVLEDFTEEAPADNLGPAAQGLVCPVSFPTLKSEGSLGERLADEISQLHAWHALALQAYQKTKLGITGCSPAELGAFLSSWLSEAPAPVLKDPAMPPFLALKFASDELKTFYYEAKSVQPGLHSAGSIQKWFWFETTAGEVFLKLRRKFAHDGDPDFAGLATLSLVPRAVLAELGEH
jgi:hypothetical protein